MKSVFVSHATADRDLVEQFVEIILKNCGLAEADIFVSSIPGMDIPGGSDLLATVRAEVSDTTLVIAVITPTYPTRPVCIAELGAAWGVAGKLLPVLVPGINRDRLEGVLNGLKTDYLNEEKTLDEIAERIETETGRGPANRSSWTRAKQRWLRAVDGLVAALPEPELVSTEQHNELKAKLSDTEQALADAESEIATLTKTVNRLKVLKDQEKVAEILLPANDIERFKALREAAIEALRVDELRRFAPAVQEAIRCRLDGGEMRWHDAEQAGILSYAEEAVSEGFLVDTGNGVVPSDDHGPVKRANRAVSALNDALRGDTFKPEFFEWFENEYDGPPKLWQGAVWRSIFGRRI